MAVSKDNRSPLAKALGERVPCKVVEVLRGRLAGVPMAVRALSNGEIQRATIEARKHLLAEGWESEDLFTELGESVFNMETAVRILAAALIVPPGGDAVKAPEAQRLTSGPDQVRALLEPDEITLLFQEFCAWQEERSPLSRAKTLEEVEDLIEALGKGQAPSSRLNAFDPSSLKSIICGLAARLMSATRPPSSPTSLFAAPAPAPSTPSGSATASPSTSAPPSAPTLTVE